MYDHDCVRCDLMADIDCTTKYPGEFGTCCVCVGHDCETALAEREKHPLVKSMPKIKKDPSKKVGPFPARGE